MNASVAWQRATVVDEERGFYCSSLNKWLRLTELPANSCSCITIVPRIASHRTALRSASKLVS